MNSNQVNSTIVSDIQIQVSVPFHWADSLILNSFSKHDVRTPRSNPPETENG